ncbi:glycosyl transferase [Planosporangium flavigriseum]|uniref:Glycosyl transferase n=1 Tax=Planosporangium flavigriseum TaxID=373681 RepID=A0A8J3LNX2_9ACTN|nr:glycosyl transferase [Planosporangium flavigriseum]NJC67042.1 glycosyl transferase [Planosporangium flavigriseum]GIG76167.1 glycosyl transferase [Planosporangium flavigriseum]
MTTDHVSLLRDSPRATDVRVRAPSESARDTRRGDWLAAIGYALVAFGVTIRLWLHPTSVMLEENRQDQVQFEWMLTNAVHTIRHLSDPFFTGLINAPFGVNLMANTSTWGLTLPLAPVTALFGAPVAFRVMLTGAFFGTALAWYHVLSRRVVASRIAAFVGGAFCAFAPGMLGQGTGHPNVVAQFVLPFIVLVVLGLRKPGRPVRTGLLLAGLVTYQIFINEEVLLLAALALGVFVLAYWAQRWNVINPLLPNALLSLAVTTVAVSVVVAYPLYRQFFGPQSYHGLPEWVLEYNTDLASYVAYAQQSLAGSKAGAEQLAQGVSEQNTFYGWGLVALLAIIVAALWRSAAVRALAVTGTVFALLSLGQYVVVGGEKTETAGPWQMLVDLPLFDSVVPTRLSLVVIPVVGVLLALFVDSMVINGGPRDDVAGGDLLTRARRFWNPVRVLGVGALVVALLPIAPTPLTVSPRQPAPRFFTSGAWRDHVPDGGTVGVLPFGWHSDVNSLQWQAEQGLRFKVLSGYFLGPDPARPDKRAVFGPGSYYVRQVLSARRDPAQVNDQEREYCLGQLRSWRTDLLLLTDDAPNADTVRANAEQILGPGRRVEDVWIWHVPSA